ncbi:MAG: proline--tRNA ligase [Nanoarchaeota archaeon]|nr:proline--tRNA ligase [Nanoarchaeota archaeon]MBU1703846.1 proline--tRNA ligase [Nanoarchaeota archaeon]
MAKEKNIGITVKKSEDISEWYTQLIQKADLADYSSVSGCMVFKPYSYAIWEKIQSEVDSRLKKMGIKNAYFPLFIPEKLLQKEATHVEGFAPEVAWVTEAGNSKLDERLAIRPTSETIMYESYSKWIRSWRDLPLRLNQWNNVVRWEFKHPVAFMRTREFLWNEGHTAFATQEEAEKECTDIVEMYGKFLKDYMALPTLLGKKSEKEKFAGAEYTLSLEMFLPSGKAIQGPDAHHDGQNFAKAFDITFLDKDEKKQYVYQNTWAITTRMIGIMLMMHGDNKGAVMPPNIAPTQIVIVPILFGDSKDKVLKVTKDIASKLKKYRLEVDERDEYSAGWKFNQWEMKGVPIRIELGPKDLEKKQVVIVRRDTGEKEFVPIKDIETKVKETLEKVHNYLYDQAKELLKQSIVEVDDLKELVKVIEAKKMAFAPFCNQPECEEIIKEKAGGAGTRNIPLNQKFEGRCVGCGKKAHVMAYFAKGY